MEDFLKRKEEESGRVGSRDFISHYIKKRMALGQEIPEDYQRAVDEWRTSQPSALREYYKELYNRSEERQAERNKAVESAIASKEKYEEFKINKKIEDQKADRRDQVDYKSSEEYRIEGLKARTEDARVRAGGKTQPSIKRKEMPSMYNYNEKEAYNSNERAKSVYSGFRESISRNNFDYFGETYKEMSQRRQEYIDAGYAETDAVKFIMQPSVENLDNKLAGIERQLKTGKENVLYNMQEASLRKRVETMLANEAVREMYGYANQLDKIQKWMEEHPELDPDWMKTDLSKAEKLIYQATGGITDMGTLMVQSTLAGLDEALYYGTMGAGIGAMYGGGIASPYTASSGALLGASFGLKKGAMEHMMMIEAGHAYLEYLEAGVDPEIAGAMATGVGLVNGALEYALVTSVAGLGKGGASLLTKFVNQGYSSSGRALTKVLSKAGVKVGELKSKHKILNFGVDYIANLTGNVAEEMSQESATIMGLELSAIMQEARGGSPVVTGTREENIARVVDTGKQSFVTMALFPIGTHLGSSGFNYVGTKIQKSQYENSQEFKNFTKALENEEHFSFYKKMAEMEDALPSKEEYETIKVNMRALKSIKANYKLTNKQTEKVNEYLANMEIVTNRYQYQAKEQNQAITFASEDFNDLEEEATTTGEVDGVDVKELGLEAQDVSKFREAKEKGYVPEIRELIFQYERNGYLEGFDVQNPDALEKKIFTIARAIEAKNRKLKITDAYAYVQSVVLMEQALRKAKILNAEKNLKRTDEEIELVNKQDINEEINPENTEGQGEGENQGEAEQQAETGSQGEEVETEAETEEVKRETPEEQPKNEKAIDKEAFESIKDKEIPKDVIYADVDDLILAPKIFQFRYNANEETGTTGNLAGTKEWDENISGVITVWQDEAGDRYVINGHHRVAKAKELGVKRILAKVVTHKEFTQEEARALGARINMAEGSATPVDIAKFMRDSNLTEADMLDQKIPPAKLRDGIALSKLHDAIFQAVATKKFNENMAVIIANGFENKDLQYEAYKTVVRLREDKGKEITQSTMVELIKQIKSSGENVNAQMNLWGADEVTVSGFTDKAEIVASVRTQLRRTKKVFKTASKEQNKERLERVGNIIDAEVNADMATEAELAEMFMDATVYSKDTRLSDDFNVLALRYSEANASEKRKIKQEAYELLIKTIEEGDIKTEKDIIENAFQIKEPVSVVGEIADPKVNEIIERAKENPMFNGVEVKVTKEKKMMKGSELNDNSKGYAKQDPDKDFQARAEYINKGNGRGEIILYEGATGDSVLEELVHHIQFNLDEIDPELGKAMWEWIANAERMAENLGFDKIPNSFELFAQALVFSEMGYATANQELADLIALPDALVENFRDVMGKEFYDSAKGRQYSKLAKKQRIIDVNKGKKSGMALHGTRYSTEHSANNSELLDNFQYKEDESDYDEIASTAQWRIINTRHENFGLKTYLGEPTATFESQVVVNTDTIDKDLNGNINKDFENTKVYKLKYKSVVDDIRNDVFDPHSEANRITVAVDSFGNAYFVNGQHIYDALKDEGFNAIPIYIDYYDGSERIGGTFYPDKIVEESNKIEPAPEIIFDFNKTFNRSRGEQVGFEQTVNLTESKNKKVKGQQSFFQLTPIEQNALIMDGFYSKMINLINKKFQGRRFKATELLTLLKKPENGVTDDEIRYSNIDKFLTERALNGNGYVYMDDLLDKRTDPPTVIEIGLKTFLKSNYPNVTVQYLSDNVEDKLDYEFKGEMTIDAVEMEGYPKDKAYIIDEGLPDGNQIIGEIPLYRLMKAIENNALQVVTQNMGLHVNNETYQLNRTLVDKFGIHLVEPSYHGFSNTTFLPTMWVLNYQTALANRIEDIGYTPDTEERLHDSEAINRFISNAYGKEMKKRAKLRLMGVADENEGLLEKDTTIYSDIKKLVFYISDYLQDNPNSSYGIWDEIEDVISPYKKRYAEAMMEHEEALNKFMDDTEENYNDVVANIVNERRKIYTFQPDGNLSEDLKLTELSEIHRTLSEIIATEEVSRIPVSERPHYLKKLYRANFIVNEIYGELIDNIIDPGGLTKDGFVLELIREMGVENLTLPEYLKNVASKSSVLFSDYLKWNLKSNDEEVGLADYEFGGAVKFKTYTSRKGEFGENYKELLFRIPKAVEFTGLDNLHFTVDNVVAHARISDVNLTEGKYLLVEEIQSDIHGVASTNKRNFRRELIKKFRNWEDLSFIYEEKYGTKYEDLNTLIPMEYAEELIENYILDFSGYNETYKVILDNGEEVTLNTKDFIVHTLREQAIETLKDILTVVPNEFRDEGEFLRYLTVENLEDLEIRYATGTPYLVYNEYNKTKKKDFVNLITEYLSKNYDGGGYDLTKVMEKYSENHIQLSELAVLIDLLEGGFETNYNFNQTQKTKPAPFKNDWFDFVMRQVVNYATQLDYDGLLWSLGDEQAKRYGLSKVVDQATISWDNESGGLKSLELRLTYSDRRRSGEALFNYDFALNDFISNEYHEKSLDDYIGQDMGDYLRNKVDEKIELLNETIPMKEKYTELRESYYEFSEKKLQRIFDRGRSDGMYSPEILEAVDKYIDEIWDMFGENVKNGVGDIYLNRASLEYYFKDKLRYNPQSVIWAHFVKNLKEFIDSELYERIDNPSSKYITLINEMIDLYGDLDFNSAFYKSALQLYDVNNNDSKILNKFIGENIELYKDAIETYVQMEENQEEASQLYKVIDESLKVLNTPITFNKFKANVKGKRAIYDEIMVRIINDMSDKGKWGTKADFVQMAQVDRSPDNVESNEKFPKIINYDEFDSINLDMKTPRVMGADYTEVFHRVDLSQKAKERIKKRGQRLYQAQEADGETTANMGELSFMETVEQMEGISRDLKDMIKSKSWSYEIKQNEKTIEEALLLISEVGEEKVEDWILGEEPGDRVMFTAGQLLISEMSYRSGRADRAMVLAKRIAEKANDAGQAIQSLSIMGRLSPQSLVSLLESTIAETRTDQEDIDLRTKSQKIRSIMDRINAEGLTKLSVGNWLKKIIEMTPEEMLNRRILKTLEPGTKDDDPVKMMIDTLFKLAKEEAPLEQAETEQIDPLEFVVEAINNRAKYREVWKLAKRQLEENLLKDDPDKLAELQPFFDLAINRTFPQSRLRQAVKQELESMELTIRNIVKEHYTVQSAIRRDLAEKLVKRAGLEDVEAQILQDYIYNEMKQLTKEAKESQLKQMFRDKKETEEQKTADQKIIELSNMGAFKHEVYKHKVAQKLGMEYASDEVLNTLHAMAQNVQTMESGRAKDIEVAKMLSLIQSQVKPTLWQKVSLFQTMMQLLNPKTMGRNLIGNFGFATTEYFADQVAVPLDHLLSLLSGNRRTKSFDPIISAKTQFAGFKKGLKIGYEDAILGIDTSELKTQYSLPQGKVFQDGLLGEMETLLNIGLRATDRAFYLQAFEEELRELMKMENVSKPTPEMIQFAHQKGLYRTFQDDNAISRLAVNLKKTLNIIGRGGFGAGDFILKYPKTPANLLARGIDYSPINLAVQLMKIAGHLYRKDMGVYEQKAIVEDLARGAVGTLGILAGVALAKVGIIKGSPDDDEPWRASAFRQTLGIRDYSINKDGLTRWINSGFKTDVIETQPGDTFVTYDWFQPGSISLAMGADIYYNEQKLRNEGEGGMLERGDLAFDLINATASGANTLIQQPLLQGLADLDSGRTVGDKVERFTEGILSSFTPTLLSQIAYLIDPTSRNPRDMDSTLRTALNMSIKKIPFLSQSLPAYYEQFGEKSEYDFGKSAIFEQALDDRFITKFVNSFIAPAITGEYNPTVEEERVLKLLQATGEAGHVPERLDKTWTINVIENRQRVAKKVVLNPEEYEELSRWAGEQTQERYSRVISRIERAPYEQQVEILKDILSGVRSDVRDKIKEMRGY